MGSAFLALYSVTADPAWLDRAIAAAQFINANFKSEAGILDRRELKRAAPNPANR